MAENIVDKAEEIANEEQSGNRYRVHVVSLGNASGKNTEKATVRGNGRGPQLGARIRFVAGNAVFMGEVIKLTVDRLVDKDGRPVGHQWLATCSLGVHVPSDFIAAEIDHSVKQLELDMFQDYGGEE